MGVNAHLRLRSSASPLQCLHMSQPWSGLDRHKTSSANYRPARWGVHANNVKLRQHETVGCTPVHGPDSVRNSFFVAGNRPGRGRRRS